MITIDVCRREGFAGVKGKVEKGGGKGESQY